MSDERITVDHPRVHAPGVYFGLSAEEYHAALALSATGCKQLRQSTMDFWARSAALNPDYQPEQTEAQAIGTAYHTRIVEGADAFIARYAPELDPDEYPDALRTIAELTEALAEHLEKPAPRALKAEIIQQLRRCDPDVVIWDELVQMHAEMTAGKKLLKSWLVDEIEKAAAMIEEHSQLRHAFRDGYPEVSVFWIDEETGVPCKSRFDYLKPQAVIDLKSFGNAQGLPIRKAIARAIALWRYHVQAAFYLEAAAAARQMVRSGDVHGGFDLAFLRAFADASDTTFLFVFEQTKVHVVRGIVMSPGILLDLANAEIEEAKHAFLRCWRKYGTAPWLDEEDITALDPAEVPTWISQ